MKKKETPKADARSAGVAVVIDPFSRSGDQVAGETADQVALNLWECVAISRKYRQALSRPAPDLREIFKGYALSRAAQSALRKSEQTLAGMLPPKSEPEAR